MNSKQRVQAALRRQPVDRPPIWMWFHPITHQRLSQELDIPASAVSEVMGDDIRQTWVGNNYAMEGIVHDHDGEEHTDDWGICWVKDGPFNQIKHSPLQDADEEQVRAYQYPWQQMDQLLDLMTPLTQWSDRYFIGCDISPCLFEMISRIRGMEQLAMDMAAEPELAKYQFSQAAAFAKQLAQSACERFDLDWLWTGDDVGGQHSMICSPASWREMIQPHLAELFGIAKSFGLPVAYHSCGAIRPIIPDLIDMGLDVLNPIQCNCPGMDPFELKKEFGKRLTFMGGVDTQHLLPHATSQEVYTATRRLLEAMTAEGGGYILAASHAVPPETPLVNIMAMYEAAGVTQEEIMDRAADYRKSHLTATATLF
jgi:uroporphyrinogen decarboxylase